MKTWNSLFHVYHCKKCPMITHKDQISRTWSKMPEKSVILLLGVYQIHNKQLAVRTRCRQTPLLDECHVLYTNISDVKKNPFVKSVTWLLGVYTSISIHNEQLDVRTKCRKIPFVGWMSFSLHSNTFFFVLATYAALDEESC